MCRNHNGHALITDNYRYFIIYVWVGVLRKTTALHSNIPSIARALSERLMCTDKKVKKVWVSYLILASWWLFIVGGRVEICLSNTVGWSSYRWYGRVVIIRCLPLTLKVFQLLYLVLMSCAIESGCKTILWFANITFWRKVRKQHYDPHNLCECLGEKPNPCPFCNTCIRDIH